MKTIKLMTEIVKFQKISIPSHGRCLSLNPPPCIPLEITVQHHTFFKRIVLLKPPYPSEFLLTFLGVSMDIIFLELYITLASTHHLLAGLGPIASRMRNKYY